jgi:hypothetical protein
MGHREPWQHASPGTHDVPARAPHGPEIQIGAMHSWRIDQKRQCAHQCIGSLKFLSAQKSNLLGSQYVKDCMQAWPRS